MRQRYDAGKRCFDVALGAMLFVAFLPTMLIVGLLIRIVLGPPVLFRQERAGRYGQPFVILKFRTLTGEQGAENLSGPDEARQTRIGWFLRRSGFDELPQLWNVLRGNMSLVGPRPLYMRYLNHYTAEQMRRHDVRPGITGLAQISGRTSIDWQRQFALDVHYVDNRSARLDGLILWRTMLMLLGLRRAPPPGCRSELTATTEVVQPLGAAEPVIGNSMQEHKR